MQTSRYYVVDQMVQALYALMGEKDYVDITVTEVIKRAQVSRAMYYIQSRNKPGEGGSPEEKYRLYARVGLMNSVLMKWLSDGKKESVEEIVNCIMKYMILI